MSATLSAVLVAGLSFSAGRRRALNEIQARCDSLEETLEQATFPITQPVADSLALLLRAEIVVFNETKQVSAASFPLDTDSVRSLREQLPAAASDATDAEVESPGWPLHDKQRDFIFYLFTRQRQADSNAQDLYVAMLFDQKSLDAASRRAAMLPLLTGLSTVGLLTTVTLLLTSRLASRIGRLQRGVQAVAGGDFNVAVADQSQDELGQLGRAVDGMSAQLKRLWNEVRHQQSERLLHQVSAGMAHQLRNTLTGARLAIELHQQTNPDAPEIDVAFRELTAAEQFVQRLILVGSGEHQQVDRPARVSECLSDVKASQELLARHLGVAIDWTWDARLEECMVSDGATLTAAVSNLVINAIQASSQVVEVAASHDATECKITVRDDGPGIEVEVAEELFEPFVSSRQEGMGLGLSVVRRASEKLGGRVGWERVDGYTRFKLRFPVCRESESS